MTRLPTIVAVAGLPACKKSTEPSSPPPAQKVAPTEPASKPAPKAPAPKPTAKPKAPPVTKEAQAIYIKGLTEGRVLAKKKQWAEAQAKFEAALAAIPMDSRALSELGWAAFQAGDLPRAREANRDSVKAATEDKLKAASLYNLGRVAEAEEKFAEAVGFYARSLGLRPHKGVARRLAHVAASAGLPPQEKKNALAPAAETLRCPGKFDGLEALCKCLRAGYLKDHGNDGDKPQDVACKPLEETKAPRVQVILVQRMELYQEEQFLVASQPGGKLEVLAHLATAYNPGAFGIWEEITHEVFKAEERGGQRLLRSEVRHSRFDSDMGIAEEEARDIRALTLCLLPADETKPVSCPAQLTLLDNYERIKSDPVDEEIEVEEGMGTPGLPIKRRTELSVDLSDQGELSVVLKAGKKTARLAAVLGTHKLW